MFFFWPFGNAFYRLVYLATRFCFHFRFQALRILGHRRWFRDGYDSPEEILRRRFASGDISKEEYDEKMNILKRSNR